MVQILVSYPHLFAIPAYTLGIVTRFNLRTVAIRDVWYCVSTYAITEVPEILLAFEQWQLKIAEPKSSVLISMGLNSCSVTLVYSAPVQKPPTCFSVFFGIDVMEYLTLPTNGTVVSMIKALAELFPHVLERCVHSCLRLSLSNQPGMIIELQAEKLISVCILLWKRTGYGEKQASRFEIR